MTSSNSKKPAPKPTKSTKSTKSTVSELLPVGGVLGKLFGRLNTVLGVFRKK